jgi:hypothetical protein
MTSWSASEHNYEEVRQVVIEILQKDPSRGGHPAINGFPNQFNDLARQVGIIFAQRASTRGLQIDPAASHALHAKDEELIRDVFWDLFRQGVITLGKNSSNDNWPWFRLSHFGSTTIRTLSPYRFHDVRSYLSLVQTADPDISPEAVVYLEEAVAAFYADCRYHPALCWGSLRKPSSYGS